MMFPNPRLVKTEAIKVVRQFEIALQGQRRILSHGVHGWKEDAEA
jgi:hypothetical protein